jgi:hypothetical protein
VFSVLRKIGRPRPKIADADAFAAWLARESAYVSQKCIMEYCRIRASHNWEKLVSEAPFADKLERCRWIGLAAIGADISVMAEGYLRPHCEETHYAALAAYLADSYVRGLERHGIAAHLDEEWRAEIEATRARLARVQMAQPVRVHLIAKRSGDVIFDLLPIHPDLRRDDRPVMVNSIRFTMCRSYENMQEQTDPVAIVADLFGEPHGRGLMP